MLFREIHATTPNQWENGWAENLQNFISSGYDPNSLIPKFIRPNQPIRLGTEFIQPTNSNFELSFLKVYRQWIFKKYLSEVENVYEFGAGTAFNLLALSELFPTKNLHGLDFVSSAVELISLVGTKLNRNIIGHKFDMIHPNLSLKIPTNSAAFTFGALEQLAGRIDAFFEFLLSQPLELCFHVEPVVDLYEETDLFDYLAYRFHTKRGYTSNLLSTLLNYEKNGRIEILNVRRPKFASLFMEGYSLIVWRPIKS